MKRRQFLYQSAMGALVLGWPGKLPPKKTHILSLSFDDGFKKSFYRIAEIHEEFGLSAWDTGRLGAAVGGATRTLLRPPTEWRPWLQLDLVPALVHEHQRALHVHMHSPTASATTALGWTNDLRQFLILLELP